MAIHTEDFNLNARDGWPLAATRHEPQGAALGIVILNSATAVRRTFYRAYAQYLAERGFLVITYDYRGIGGSRGDGARQARTQHWGELDFAGVLDTALALLPGKPVFCVGHSIGGQIVGLADNAARLSGFIGIGAQSGWWGHWPLQQWPRMLAAWYLLIPIFAITLGYVPGAFIGGEALPAGIARQWAFWGRQKHYISDDAGQPWRPHFADYRGPARFYAVEDDHAFAPLPAVQAMAACYDEAAMAVKVLKPAEFGLKRIGHFGYFKRDAPRALWDETGDWLISLAHAITG